MAKRSKSFEALRGVSIMSVYMNVVYQTYDKAQYNPSSPQDRQQRDDQDNNALKNHLRLI
jgi:hypothetical protein